MLVCFIYHRYWSVTLILRLLSTIIVSSFWDSAFKLRLFHCYYTVMVLCVKAELAWLCSETRSKHPYFIYRLTQKKIPHHGNLNILAMPCWIITKISGIAKEIIWHMLAKFHVCATCCSKIMALLLKRHVYSFIHA